MQIDEVQSRNEFLFCDPDTHIELFVKRLDYLFPESIGNKAYKLKYNIEEAQRKGYESLVTFGGAFSNHIAAVASVGPAAGLKTIGLIRGEELGIDRDKTFQHNSTLRKAFNNGMKLDFISRQVYREKEGLEMKNYIERKYGPSYILPEGGTNALAVKGCEEILSKEDERFDFICCPVGTGGTLSGIANSAFAHQKVLGFATLKADLNEVVRKYTVTDNWEIFEESVFGGFGKINTDLVSFINRFNMDYGILLDPIYTGKMLYSIIKKLNSGFFGKNTRILAIHTGGLQGIDGMNQRLIKKKLPTIEK